MRVMWRLRNVCKPCVWACVSICICICIWNADWIAETRWTNRRSVSGLGVQNGTRDGGGESLHGNSCGSWPFLRQLAALATTGSRQGFRTGTAAAYSTVRAPRQSTAMSAMGHQFLTVHSASVQHAWKSVRMPNQPSRLSHHTNHSTIPTIPTTQSCVTAENITINISTARTRTCCMHIPTVRAYAHAHAHLTLLALPAPRRTAHGALHA
jgi:hypothetical protein